MKTYARIQDGLIAELLKTDGDITSMFNHALVWMDISSQPNVGEGWHFDGTKFTPPPARRRSHQFRLFLSFGLSSRPSVQSSRSYPARVENSTPIRSLACPLRQPTSGNPATRELLCSIRSSRYRAAQQR